MTIDYSVIVEMVANIVSQALPIGIIFILSERLVQMFLKFAFPLATTLGTVLSSLNEAFPQNHGPNSSGRNTSHRKIVR